MKPIIYFLTFILLCFTYVLVVYSDEISVELTHNLNRNLDIDWGINHPKFEKHKLKVDFLDLSVSWDYFNIAFPLNKGAHMLGSLSAIKSNGCISNLALFLNVHIDISCNEVKIEIKRNEWVGNDELHISRTFFFERRIFDDFYDKQGNYNVKINAKNFFINNVNLGQYEIEYSFIDTDKLYLMINGEDFLLTKQTEGLNINTPDTDYFFLNQVFYENTM